VLSFAATLQSVEWQQPVEACGVVTCVRACVWLQSNLKAFMDYVRKNDLEKISALTNKGFDPNFIDRASGGSLFNHHRLQTEL